MEARTKIKNKHFKYVWAYDPTIGKRVAHLVKGRIAISVITGHMFKLTKEEMKRLRKEEINGRKIKNKT
ncbi:MAG: hypothetical protein M0Z70_11740 [Nitrospiraceae bacterium]|nr:hypothetical protein [Nitrospiraceae bacterium]